MSPLLDDLPLWLDIALTVLLVLGAAISLVGSWALVRLPDFLMRLHGPTKATTLGVGCVLIASSIYFSAQQGSASWHELLITLFLFLTAPVSAHLLVKALLKTNPALRPPLPRRQFDSPSEKR
ncbi:MAG: Na+/H+ antiporter subunit G [Burkholderiales bacterium]|jgi:multicomponent K+:H+ antiporter subunit G|nr:Na+/H+ antiporter subunit G [Burkholderiales bacterium]